MPADRAEEFRVVNARVAEKHSGGGTVIGTAWQGSERAGQDAAQLGVGGVPQGVVEVARGPPPRDLALPKAHVAGPPFQENGNPGHVPAALVARDCPIGKSALGGRRDEGVRLPAFPSLFHYSPKQGHGKRLRNGNQLPGAAPSIPVIWDPCLARAVAAELRARLARARARAVCFRREAAEVVVHFRDATLVVDLSPRRGLVVLEPASAPGVDGEPLPAVLASVDAVPDERVLVLRFRRVRGKKPDPSLIIELATNRWNAILADGAKLRVRKRMRSVKGRPLPIGQPWVSPRDEPGARARGPVDREGWAGLIEGLAEAEARSALLSRVAHVSGLNVAYLLGAPNADEGFRRWRQMAAMTDPTPHLLHVPSGLQPYPWPLPGTGAEPVGSLLEGMEAVLAATDAGPAAGGGQVSRYLAVEARGLARKLKQLRRQLEKTASAERLREDGGLILSSLHLIEAGARQATLVGFDGGERTVELDPRLRPQEHATALFRRATRLERGAAALPARISAAEEALARIAQLQGRHERGEISAEEVEAMMPARPERARPHPGSPTLPYRTYTSSGGLDIRVGRGARHNDDLTFRHSRPTDVWLHARHAAGAHVILRWTRPERPPATDLEEAAILAANHSGARSSGHVPVDWTRRKWVRKPRGAPPGAVIPDRVQTVFVSPDPSLAERLGGG